MAKKQDNTAGKTQENATPQKQNGKNAAKKQDNTTVKNGENTAPKRRNGRGGAKKPDNGMTKKPDILRIVPKEIVASKKQEHSKVKIMMLGGLNEIGKNLCVMEYENDIIIVDCGLAFPDEDMPGIDLVIPDFTYLEKNASKIRGVLLTHGHEDHIGGLPYLLKLINVPVYGTKLTLGILENKLAEHRILNSCNLNTVTAGTVVKLGAFKCEFIRANHSIADACMIAIRTPVGIILHTGDFKLDVSPIGGEMMDLTRIGEYGREGVLLLMCESTNVDHPGFTPSEKKVGFSLTTFS